MDYYVFSCLIYCSVILYKFVQLPVWNSYPTLLNCTSKEVFINVMDPKYGSQLPGKCPGSLVTSPAYR